MEARRYFLWKLADTSPVPNSEVYIPHDSDQHTSDGLGIFVVIVNSSGGESADRLHELL
jgi:hypothetical protein